MDEINNVKKVAKGKKKNNNKKNKVMIKRRILTFSVILIIVVLIVVVSLCTNKKESVDFAEALLSKDYYIKMVEVDEEFNEKGETVAFTRTGEDIAIATDIQTVILKDDVYAQILHVEKLILQYPRDSIVNNIQIGLAGLDNKKLQSEKQEKLNGKEYACKTYESGIKLYYEDDEIKYYVSPDGIVKIIEFEGNVNEELFELPEDYVVANEKQEE